MNEMDINLRKEQLRDLQKYVKDIDKDITLILHSLQWDRKRLQKVEHMVTCKYDSNHRIMKDNAKEHEEKCYLTSQNYLPGDLFFPEPFDANAVTVVKLSADNINDIINYAVKTDPSFKRSGASGVPGYAPLTLGGLQAALGADERRALHDAVVAAAPPRASHFNVDSASNVLAPCVSARADSPGEALVALRDARRRRAKHRPQARGGGYRHELRGLISAQMESFVGKGNDEDADGEVDVANYEIVDGRRSGRESDRRDRGRDDARAKYLNPNRRDRESESRDDRRKKYEYDKKSNERNKIYEHEDRRRQRQYDKKYLKIKQEKDDYPDDDRRKREERSYDYKERKREKDRFSSRDKKKYRREDRHRKQKSAERPGNGSREREYDRIHKRDIECSYLKIKKEPPDYN